MKSAIFWVVTPCARYFREMYFVNLQGGRVSHARNRWQASQKIMLFIFTTLRTSDPMTGKCFLGIDAPRTVVKIIVIGVTF
jgi:hypothetical protein